MQDDAKPHPDADKKPEEERVITPGGPAYRKNVHTVGPGEEVRRNPDGSHSVVPRPKRGAIPTPREEIESAPVFEPGPHAPAADDTPGSAAPPRRE